MKKTKGLGKGLSALFGDQKKPVKSKENEKKQEYVIELL